MIPGKIYMQNNNRMWRLVQQIDGDLWFAHTVVADSLHMKGVSTPIHVINVSHLEEAPDVENALAAR